MTGIVYISQLNGAVAGNASPADLVPVTQGSTGPGTGTTRKMSLAELAGGALDVVNVMAFGAVGDGVTADSTAIQLAANQLPASGGILYFPPGRTFLINSTIFLPYKTKIFAYGATFTTVASGSWISPTYFGIYICFTTPTFGDDGIMHDGNYGLYGATFDFTANSSATCWTMWYCRDIEVRDCHFIGGQTQCQHVRTENTTVSHCTFETWRNVACDHFDSPQDVRISNCFFYSKIIDGVYGSQATTFNAVPVVSRPQVGTADGFIMEACEFRSDNPNATPCQLEPLGESATSKNVTVTGNIFRNTYLVCRGDCQIFDINNNKFLDTLNRQAIVVGLRIVAGKTPDSIMISYNQVINPVGTTTSGLIQCEATNWAVTFNRVIGSLHGSSPSFYSTTSQGVFFGNQYSNGVAVLSLYDIGTIGYNVINNQYISLYDTAGSRARWRVQSDNNMVFSGSSSTGTERAFMSLLMRSDTSELTFQAPLNFQGIYRELPSSGIAATGTVIGTAALLTSNLNRVTSCTVGVNDGVILIASTGRRQTVVNETAAALKVYPNNSGAATIDGGAVGAPVTVAANTSRTFVQVAANNFRTI